MAPPRLICRICFEPAREFPCGCVYAPCHPECLRRWAEVSGRKTCEICGHPFVAFLQDLFQINSDIPLDLWRCLAWSSLAHLALPVGCLAVVQLAVALHYREPFGVFLMCQLLSFRPRLIRWAACLRLAATCFRRWSTWRGA